MMTASENLLMTSTKNEGTKPTLISVVMEEMANAKMTAMNNAVKTPLYFCFLFIVFAHRAERRS